MPPGLVAIALMVVFLSTETGPVQGGVAGVGVLPSVVQRMTAPGVALLIVTCWADSNVPGAGLKVGAAGGGHDVSGVHGIVQG